MICEWNQGLALILKFLTKDGNINSIYHSDKISTDCKCWSRFVSEMILPFSMKIQPFESNSDMDWMTHGWMFIEICRVSFKFKFKSGFNLPANVLAYSNEK